MHLKPISMKMGDMLNIFYMKEYITVKNFGPLMDIDLLELRRFTILIGESAIGKSTLMKLVSMMRYLYKMANIRSYLKLSQITSSPFRFRLGSLMKQSELVGMLMPNSVIVYKVIADSGNEYEIKIVNKKLVTLPSIREEDIVFSKVSFVSENRNIIPTWIEKTSSNRGATLGYYFHETFNDFSAASEMDQVVDLKYLNLKLHVTHPKGKNVKLKIENTVGKHGPVDLRESSSGIQTSAPLALIVKHFAHDFSFKDAFTRSVLYYLHEIDRLTKFKAVKEPSLLKKEVYVHVEEPELSLFPTAQCYLIDELMYTALHAKEDREVNLMFATHSPYILNYLNVVLHQNKEGRARTTAEAMAVYRIFDGRAQNLLGQDEHGNDIVDSYDLTETMNDIYQEYTSFFS